MELQTEEQIMIGEFDAGGFREEYSPDQINALFPHNRLAEVTRRLGGTEFRFLFDLQEKLGLEIHLTGGMVRDSLTGQDAKDFDLVVRFGSLRDGYGKADYVREFEEFFGKKTYPRGESKPWARISSYGKLTLVKKRFGVYKFMPAGSNMVIDIAFPRTEFAPEESSGKAGDIIARSDPVLDFTRDVVRRDFTVNGIGIKLERNGEGMIGATVEDHVGGVPDLRTRTLRAIGNPDLRFAESLDRVVRAVYLVQKGFQPEKFTREALKRAVSGNGGGLENRAFRKRIPDDGYVVSRETISLNLMKAMKLNPVGTLSFLEEIGALDDLFPDLRSYRQPVDFGEDMPERIAARMGRPDIQADSAIRRRYYEMAKRTVSRLAEDFPDASLEQVFFLLFLNLGKSRETLLEMKDGNREIHHHDYIHFSCFWGGQITREMKLTQPEKESFRLDFRIVNGWLNKITKAFGFFGDGNRILNGKMMTELKSVFPLLSADPLWQLVRSYVSAAEDAPAAAARISRVEELLLRTETESLKQPGFLQGLLNGHDLIAAFAMEPGAHLSDLLKRGEIKYSELVISGHEPLSVALVKRRLFAYMINQAEIRKYWRSAVTEADTDLLTGPDAGEDEREYCRRIFIRALERKAALSYLGETPEETAVHESPEFSREHMSLTSLVKRRKTPEELGFPGGLRASLIQLLDTDPEKIYRWIEEGLREKNSLARMLFPQLASSVKKGLPSASDIRQAFEEI